MRSCSYKFGLKQGGHPHLFLRNLYVNWVLLLLPCIAIVSVQASQKGKLPPAVSREIDFNKDIEPIFSAHCIACHGAEKQKGGLRLDNRESALKGGENYAPAIKPHHSEESPLIQFVAGQVADMKMPQKGENLTVQQIGLLRAWIDQGAPWPQNKKVPQKIYWSLKPVERPKVPAVRNFSGAKTNPIDAFILTKLKEKKLSFADQTDRRSFIRRIYLVMHGVPPTPNEVTQFLNDHTSTNVQSLIHRVLDSPRYGERWARHWMDVVRFAESNGFETNHERNNAYHYRDYVIQSFNDDKPYDRFVREQVAGDFFGGDAGTGFLVAGAYDIVKSPDINLTLMQRQDELADIVNTTGTAFLGLTLGCARCHDHKFDPIPQKDFFAVQAVFAGVNFADRPLGLNLSEEEKLESSLLTKSLAFQNLQLTEFRQKAADIKTASLPNKSLLPPVNEYLNTEEINPLEAISVRFTILETTTGEPCLDEIEIYDTTGMNVALASVGTKPSASGTLPGYAIHQLAHINDGLTGNNKSWISDTPGKGWIQLNFPSVKKIQRIVWGRDRERHFKDRLATKYRIEAQSQPNKWVYIASYQNRESQGKEDSNAFLSYLSETDSKLALELQTKIKNGSNRFNKLSIGTPAWIGTFAQPKPTHRLYRGDPLQEREQVAPSAVGVIGSLEMAMDEPEQQRRVKFAEWLTSERNPLTARVMVNRIWHYIFGTGIVDTPSDFGVNGGTPVNLPLLDWLADEFVQSGWSIKHIQKLILSSQTFGQSSVPRSKGIEKDADTRWLWRFPPRRLEAESIRDCILATSGAMDFRMGGAGFSLQIKENDNVDRYFPKEHFTTNEFRRMVYLTRIRQQQDSVFGAFDCPSGNQVIPKRTRSNTPLQALNLFNSNFVVQQAEILAGRLHQSHGDQLETQIAQAFQLLYARNPDGFEKEASMTMIQEQGLEAFCRALYNTSEFLFVF